MTFTLESIKKAQKLYTGPDFPKLVREYKIMGIVLNTYNIESGIVSYKNELGEIIEDIGIKVELAIPEISNFKEALSGLKRNQQGQTDFITFCNEVAMAGIYKWVIDTEKMSCDYYNKNEEIIISETIPTVN